MSGADSEMPQVLSKRARNRRLAQEMTAADNVRALEQPPMDPKVVALMALARELGYTCKPLETYKLELSTALLQKMKNRVGGFVYQAVAFNIPFQKEAAERLLVASLITQTKNLSITWRAETTEQARTLLGDLFEFGSKRGATGLSKPLQTLSERCVRVVATVAPALEMSWVRDEQGLERLYVNMQYVLFTDMGDIYWPKDGQRREILFSQEEEQDLRTAVLQDLLQTDSLLAPRFWRQLGQEEKAAEVEALLSQPQRQAHAASSAVEDAMPQAAEPETFQIAEILEEHRTAGRAKMWYLVRWEGYRQEWEAWRIRGDVGSPLETWEPLSHVRGTEAFQRWQAAQEEGSSS